MTPARLLEPGLSRGTEQAKKRSLADEAISAFSRQSTLNEFLIGSRLVGYEQRRRHQPESLKTEFRRGVNKVPGCGGDREGAPCLREATASLVEPPPFTTRLPLEGRPADS